MDDGGSVGAVLAQPSAGILRLEQGFATAEGGGVEPFGFAARHRGDRIVEQHEADPEQEGDDHCRQRELPHRNAGGTQHHEFGGAAQHQEDADGADQNGEGENEFGERRQTQQRHPGEEDAWNIAGIVAGATEHLDEVDEEDQHATDQEHRQHGDEEAQRKVARKRSHCTDAWHLRSHVACIPLPAQNLIVFGWNFAPKLSLDRSFGAILACAAQAAIDNRPQRNAVNKHDRPGCDGDHVAGGNACHAQADRDAEGRDNLPPTALPRGAGMAEKGDGDEGEDEGVERGCKAIMQFRAKLRIIPPRFGSWSCRD